MKVLCNGSVFDTHGATLVASGGGNEWSDAGWHLYEDERRSFVVLYGHEGQEIGFRAVNSCEAKALKSQNPGRMSPT
jgi:hypothetical protein